MFDSVDARWYLSVYPDVAAAGVDPHDHYRKFGRSEGRLPRRLRALELEMALWGGFSQAALADLTILVREGSDNADEQVYAGWALMRWYAAHEDWSSAALFIELLSREFSRFIGHLGLVLLVAEVCLRCYDRNKSHALVRVALEKHGLIPDLCLAASNVALASEESLVADDAEVRLYWVNRALAYGGLTPIAKRNLLLPLSLSNLRGDNSFDHVILNQPKISVIMPVFNAEKWVEYALQSILEQSWRNLEIIVVDDCSTDATRDVVRHQTVRDERVRLLKQARNTGAYAARNAGLNHATGSLIVTHDSDDWSHPQRLELMARPIVENEQIVASMCCWVRCDSVLHFQRWRMENSLIHSSVATLMFRRAVFDQLGAWDEVRVDADTELYRRVLKVWSDQAVSTVLPGVPLVFALRDQNSLTNTPATHLRTQFWGLRRVYRELSETWHALCTDESLYLERAATVRPFSVPAQLISLSPQPESFDWVVMANFGADTQTLESLRRLLERMMHRGDRVGLFHWPDYRQLQHMARWFLEQAVVGRLHVVLPGQSLKVRRMVRVGRQQPDNLPDGLPVIDCSEYHVVENVEVMLRRFESLPDVSRRCLPEYWQHFMTDPLLLAPFDDDDRYCIAFMKAVALDLCRYSASASAPPLVSIIMPAFNRQSLVGEAISSVFAQTYQNFELIVIDDFSADLTVDVVQMFAGDRVKIIKNTKKVGVSAARNQGLARAKGSLVAYLDTDNTWEPEYLAAMVGAFMLLPDADAVYSGQFLYRGDDVEPYAMRFGCYNSALLQNSNYIDINCFMHRRSVSEGISCGFAEELRRLVDWEFIMRIARKGTVYSIPIVASNYFVRKAHNSISEIEVLEPAYEEIVSKNSYNYQQLHHRTNRLQRPVVMVVFGEESDDDIRPCLDAALTACNDPLLSVIWGSGHNLTIDGLSHKRCRITSQVSFKAALQAVAEVPEADLLVLGHASVLMPGSLHLLQTAAYSEDERAITVPQYVVAPGSRQIQRHVPYANPKAPCDITLSHEYQNIIDVPLFHSGKELFLDFSRFDCAYIKRVHCDQLLALGIDGLNSFMTCRLICDYIRYVIRRKIVYVASAVCFDASLWSKNGCSAEDVGRS